MQLSQHLATHFRQIHFGGNWTASNLKGNLTNVTWQQATTKVDSFNTIATLAFHINYFVNAALQVLKGLPLNAHDKFSFDHPPIECAQDWENFLNKMWREGEEFAALVEQLPEQKLWESFSAEKYGTYCRNIQGIIEHSHYHLGQIVVIHKLVVAAEQHAAT